MEEIEDEVTLWMDNKLFFISDDGFCIGGEEADIISLKSNNRKSIFLFVFEADLIRYAIIDEHNLE